MCRGTICTHFDLFCKFFASEVTKLRPFYQRYQGWKSPLESPLSVFPNFNVFRHSPNSRIVEHSFNRSSFGVMFQFLRCNFWGENLRWANWKAKYYESKVNL